MLNEEQKKLELIQKLSDKWWRLNNIYYIANEDWETILFKPNTIQTKVYHESSEFRDIILKYRQWWVSTYKIIDLLDDCLFWWTNRNNVFITHRQDLLEEFFKRLRFSYDHIPAEIRAMLPIAKVDNANELYFPKTPSWKNLHNSVKIALDVRWKTPTNLHISEFAFIEPTKQQALKLQIDSFRKTRITIETTANWLGNAFYYMCMTAKEWKWTYKLLFYPWYIEERNRAKAPKDFCPMTDEKQLMQNYWLDIDQIYWRRLKIEDANAVWKNWLESFNQENPITIESAFISSWASVFDLNAKFKIVKPIEEYMWWKIFQEPQDDLIFWVDIAEWWNTGDFSAITCYNRKWEIVLTYKWRVDEAMLARKLDEIFLYEKDTKKYLWWIIPENNIWRLFIKECQTYNWAYRIHHEIRTDMPVNETRETNKFWFRTTQPSKDFIIRLFRWAIHKMEVEVSEEIKSEIDTYQYDWNNRPNAIAPNHDDILMSAMIWYFAVTKIFWTIEYDKPKQLEWDKIEDIRDRDVNSFILHSQNNLQKEENDYYEIEEFN